MLAVASAVSVDEFWCIDCIWCYLSQLVNNNFNKTNVNLIAFSKTFASKDSCQNKTSEILQVNVKTMKLTSA